MFFRNTSTGSIRSLAARSSIAAQPIKDACGWFGARQARAEPVLVETAVWLMRRLGTLVNTYGNNWAFIPPPPIPPVDHVSDCHAVIVPSLCAATLTLPKIEGRLPAIVNSVSRSRKNFTGRPPLIFESLAHSIPHVSAGNLLPNPPPIYCICTWTSVTGILMARATSPPMPETFCVDGQYSTLLSFFH